MCRRSPKMIQPKTFIVTVGALLMILSCHPRSSYGYLFKDEKHGTQLSIFGLGMIRFNYAFVDGDAEGFEQSDDGFREQFDTQEFLSLTLNGVLFRDYALEGEVRYDEAENPISNYRLKLSRDEHYLIVGDQPNIFSEPYFTRYTSPFRGLTLHVGTQKVGVTTFGAVTKGSLEKEELTPDGTSGVYVVQKIPVVPGSDIVTIEVRNRNDRQHVIETRPQQRNIDYTIDYDTGEIMFTSAVERETFEGDPLVIVVIYRSATESASYATSIAGGRITVSPTGWANIGVTYVSEFNRDPSLSKGFDARQEVYGIDGTVTIGDALKLTTEYALSRDLAKPADSAQDASDLRHAFRAKLDGKIGDNVEFNGNYELAERDFLTFANPDINPNEQQLDLAGKYFYHPRHFLEAGYSFWQDNLPQEATNPTTTTHRPFVGWDAYLWDHTEVFARYELIHTTDDQSPAVADQQTQTVLVGGNQEFLSVPVFKKVILRGEYQWSDFEDATDQEPDTITHQAAIRARAEPAKATAVYVEQRERLIYDKDRKQNIERQDISEIGAELNQWERFTLQPKYQYRRTQDLLLDRLKTERHTVLVSSKFTPFSVLTGAAKVEFSREKVYAAAESDAQSSAQTFNAEGRVIYTPIKDFTARLTYKYEQREDKASETSTRRNDETEFRINYALEQHKTRLNGAIKIERDLLETPPTPQTNTRTITYLASAARQMTDHWDLLAQYKREVEQKAVDTARDDVLGEIGYALGRFIKLTAGYEYTRFSDHQNTNKDYTANSIYLKLIGKL